MAYFVSLQKIKKGQEIIQIIRIPVLKIFPWQEFGRKKTEIILITDIK